MTEPSGDQPFFESRKPPPGPASAAPRLAAVTIVSFVCFVLSCGGLSDDLRPEERGGAMTFVALAIFVFGLIAAGVGALVLGASLARKQKQRTFGEDFGLLFCAGLASGAAALAFSLLLDSLGA